MPNSTQNKQPTKSSSGGLHPSLSERQPTVNVDIAPLIPYLQLPQERFAASQDAQVKYSWTDSDELSELARQIVVRPPDTPIDGSTSPSTVLSTSQFWEGLVVSVTGQEFVATVRDRTDPQNPDEEIVMDLDEVSEIDQHLVRPGATFYWIIGKSRTPSGQQLNISTVQFRRSPHVSRAAAARATRWAERIGAFLRSDV